MNVNKNMAVITQAINSKALPFLMNSVTGEKSECRESTERADKILLGIQKVDNTQIMVQTVDEDNFIETLKKLHNHDYLQYLRDKSETLEEGDTLMAHPFVPSGVDNDTPIVKDIYAQALESAKTAYCAADKIAHGYEMSYGICRPPGHHAGKGFLGGYCYLNNAAIAAHTLYQSGKSKVAVLDIDFHFGNGTADLLLDNPAMFFCSIHCSTDIDYPYRPTAERNETELYIPFTEKPSEEEYLKAVDTALAAICRFGAEAIVLSVGYDIIEEDPHGKWHISSDIYSAIGRKLKDTNIPLCLIQEGGYAIEKLGECAENLCRGLMD